MSQETHDEQAAACMGSGKSRQLHRRKPPSHFSKPFPFPDAKRSFFRSEPPGASSRGAGHAVTLPLPAFSLTVLRLAVKVAAALSGRRVRTPGLEANLVRDYAPTSSMS